jgi:hypothetical protein
MKTIIAALLAVAFIASPAYATGNHTCPYGGTYPNCKPKPQDPPTNPGNSQQQQQNQTQQQAANANAGAIGIGKGGDSKSNAVANGGKVSNSGNSSNRNANKNNNAAVSGSKSGANSSSGASSASGMDTSGNSAVQIDQSDRGTYSTKSSFVVMSDLPANAMNIVPGAMLTSTGDTQCGYLQSKVRIPIKMWISKKKQVEVGYDEDIVPFRDENGVQQDLRAKTQPDGSIVLGGHMVLISSSTLSNASNFQFGAQGGKDSAFGGLGYGSGSGQQQIGQRIILRDCRYGVIPARTAPQAVYKPRPVAKRKPARRAPARCVPRPAKVCTA